MDKQQLQSMIDQGLVSERKHPTADLFIYNYTATVQYEKLWNEITLQTRGLILDGDMNVVAKPFGKFFNLGEHEDHEIPNEPFKVFDKLDGSLGILYWIEDKPYISTRGSFQSEQAIHATSILYQKYSHVFDDLKRDTTYLFEIIYPANRIVVDYGSLDNLFLLTAIDNSTGEESLPDIGFPLVRAYDGITDFRALSDDQESNKEGYVIRFDNGFRIKMKFNEYVRLHAIITGFSTVSIWRSMRAGDSFDQFLNGVPDEFYKWVKSTQGKLEKEFDVILNNCKFAYDTFDTRKETALYFQKQKHPSVLFAMLDDRPYDDIIWKMIRPIFTKPFYSEV